MKITFLLYPVSRVKVEEDSSFWMLWELKKRGHEVSYFESHQLFASEKSVYAFLTPARLAPKRGYLPSPPSNKPTDLAEWDCIFIRKEPRFDSRYLHALQLLERIKAKTFILNDPRGIAMANEKLFPLEFREFLPETLVTENVALARKFIRDLSCRVVIKPLDDKGGHGIFSLKPSDVNLPSLLDIATCSGKRKILIQRFIEHTKMGDKRILVLNGKVLGAFSRRPSPSDFRANLSVGATMHRSLVSRWDEELVAKMSPRLSENGLYFVGIDVIGKYLTEVNVTSPAGIPEIHHFDKSYPEKKVADFIEQQLVVRKRS